MDDKKLTPTQAFGWWRDNATIPVPERAATLRKLMHKRSYNVFAEAQIIATLAEHGRKPKRRPSPAVIRLMRQKAAEREIWQRWLERGITFYGEFKL